MHLNIKTSLKAILFLGAAVALVGGTMTTAEAASMVDRDLDRRVSDLEAEVRLLKNRVKALEDRKLAVPDKIVVSGNSRVKVTLFGRVNRATRFAFSSRNTEIHHVGNDLSSSRIGILAKGRLFPDLQIAALTEVEWQENRRSNTSDNNDGNLRVRARKVEIWFTHATLGRLYMGHGANATDDVTEMTLAGTDMIFDSTGCANEGLRFYRGTNAFAPNGLAMGAACGNLDRGRENRIMYISPKIAGFHVRVSHGEQDALDAALFYDGSPFGMRDIEVIGAFGYTYLPGAGASVPGRGRGLNNVYGGTLGILHKPTGLNINASAGVMAINATKNPHFWYVEGGWQGKIWSMGKTYLSANVGNYNQFTADTHAWVAGVAFRQKVDAAATDLYVGYRWNDAKLNGASFNAVHVIVVGARIKF